MYFGVEKLILKNQQMIAYLVSNAESFYQSDIFGTLLQYAASHPHQCSFQEKNGKRSIAFFHIKTVDDALQLFNELKAKLEQIKLQTQVN